MAEKTEVEQIIDQPSESQQRITQLSKKAKEEAEAKEAALTGKAEAETKAAEAEKRAAFAEGFADVMSANPAAKDFKADIQAKVMGGMSVEDATYAVLGKAGKLTAPVVEVHTQTAGGSAATSLPNQGTDKAIADMTQEERRSILVERENELQGILAPRTQR